MQSGNPNDQGDDPSWQPNPDQYQNQQDPGFQPPPSPGQFQYPPPYNAPQQRQSGFRQWFRTRTRITKFGLGCGAIIAILLFFLCSIAAVGSTMVASTQTSTPTVTATTGQAAVIASPGATQQTPTAVPTPKPTPVPTKAVQPTQPLPTPKPTQPPPPTPTPASCQAVNGNPWCYNFNPGNLIYYPPSGFCNYFNCIPSFVEPDDPGDGYIVECNDSMFSQSGGERGACSYHGGVWRPLYSH